MGESALARAKRAAHEARALLARLEAGREECSDGALPELESEIAEVAHVLREAERRVRALTYTAERVMREVREIARRDVAGCLDTSAAPRDLVETAEAVMGDWRAVVLAAADRWGDEGLRREARRLQRQPDPDPSTDTGSSGGCTP